jgi:hypothetical protein
MEEEIKAIAESYDLEPWFKQIDTILNSARIEVELNMAYQTSIFRLREMHATFT